MSTLGTFVDEGTIPDRATLYDPDLDAQYGSGEYKLNQERKRIMRSPHLSDQDKIGLCGFDKALRDENNRENNRKPVTRSLYLCTARLLQKDSGLLLHTTDAGDEGKERLNDLLEWVQNQGYSGNYIHKLMITIKTYGELCGSDEVQARFEPITPGQWREDNKPPNPSNVLSWADALEMADTRRHTRDQAIIVGLWGSACRPKSEFHELKYKHVEWCGDHYKISVPWDGKTGERTIRLYPGAATLRKWIEQEHPVHDDPDATLGPETYLWTKLDKNEHISYDTISTVTGEAGEAVGLNKDYNPRHFRRSRASYLAGKPTISGHELRNFCGWEINSPAPRAYISKFRKDIDRNIAMADGASTETIDDVQVVAPIHCNHCDQVTERGREDCVWCSATVDEELHEQAFGLEDPETEGMNIFEIIKEQGITADDIESLERLRPLIKQQGDRLYDDIEMLKRAVEGMDSGNCVTGPGSYLARLSAGIATAAGSATEAWGRAKAKAAAIHPTMIAPSQMSTRRKAWFYTSMVGSLVMMLVVLYIDGALQDLASGDPTEWLGLLLAVAFWKWLMDRNFPDIEEARAAAREQEA
jgi:integrase